VFSIFKSLARAGQTSFRFSRALPALGKRVFNFQEPCPPWASLFYFGNILARAGQACFYFILPLPALGKAFSIPFSIILCVKFLSI
jgi:hypothetical protein